MDGDSGDKENDKLTCVRSGKSDKYVCYGRVKSKCIVNLHELQQATMHMLTVTNCTILYLLLSHCTELEKNANSVRNLL